MISKFVILMGLLTSSIVMAEDSLNFDGEVYVKKYTKNLEKLKLTEYVREDETLENWTKLLAIRNFPNLEDPRKAVHMLGAKVRQQNPKARMKIRSSVELNEGQIDFITWVKGSGVMEFNVHKYLESDDYIGLISYQFAYKFSVNDKEAFEYFKKKKNKWVGEIIKSEFAIDFEE